MTAGVSAREGMMPSSFFQQNMNESAAFRDAYAHRGHNGHAERREVHEVSD